MSTIKQMVKDNWVDFEFYREGNLWYKVNGYNFSFPVPISDIGTAVFPARDKAILYMRWMRPHLEMLKKAQAESEAQDRL